MGRVMEMVERTGDKVVVFSQSGTAFVVTTFDDYEKLTVVPKKQGTIRPAPAPHVSVPAEVAMPEPATDDGADQYYMEPVE